MAITKIHSIKSTLHKSVAYICNPEKTDGQILISSFSCSPQTAEYDFRFALSKTKGSDANLAYHLIQSFAPGEVSFEEAHAIGVELADQHLQGKYSYIVATHIDKDHCHNHIIFCAADNVDYRKYHDCRQTYRQIRQLNDKLCKEHNLSVIVPGQEQGAKHNEWEAKKDGTSWKEKMRLDINDAIAQSSSYEVFLEILRAKGYEIKGESLDSGNSKYIAFRPLGKERFVRGSAKSLGPEFTREQIVQRIEERSKISDRGQPTSCQEPSLQQQEQLDQLAQFRKKHPVPLQAKTPAFPDQKKPLALIQIPEEKLKNSPGLRAWQERQNLKIAAQVFAATDSIAELEAEVAGQRNAAKEAKNNIAALDKEIKELQEIIYYVKQFTETLPVEKRYRSAKNKELFEQKHHTQLRLHEGSTVVLQKHGIKVTAKLSVEKFQQRLQELLEQKEQLRETQKDADIAARKAEEVLQILQQYLNNDLTQQTFNQISIPTPFLN